MVARLKSWAEERLGWDDIAHLAQKKEVPIHQWTIFYYLGGMALFLFSVQVATGILLLLYYRPSSAEAFESVQYMMADVPFGWLIRSIHSWGANLFVGVVFLHMIIGLLPEGLPPAPRGDLDHRAPCSSSWRWGSASPGTCSPGTPSPTSRRRSGPTCRRRSPVIGHLLSRILRGGSDVTGATLSRFYGIHVAILPAITTVLLGLHLYLVQRHGMSVPPAVEREGKPKTMRFLPDFLLRDMVGWLVAVALLAALAAFLPWELGVKADPFAPAPAGIRPEWYFLWMFQALKYLPAKVAGIPGETLGVFAIGGLAGRPGDHPAARPQALPPLERRGGPRAASAPRS